LSGVSVYFCRAGVYTRCMKKDEKNMNQDVNGLKQVMLEFNVRRT